MPSWISERIYDRGFPWSFFRFLAKGPINVVLNAYVAGPVWFQCMRVAIKLGLFDALRKNRPMTHQQLSQALGIDEYPLSVLLHALLAMKLIKRTRNGYRNTVFVRFVQEKQILVLIDHVHELMYRQFYYLEESIHQKEPAAGWPVGPAGHYQVFGHDYRNLYEALPHLPQHVRDAWFELDHFWCTQTTSRIDRDIDFSRHTRLLDVGGNTGVLSIPLAQKFPHLHITLVDLPGPVDLARQRIREAGLDNQIETVACDVLAAPSLPRGYDAAICSQFVSLFSERHTREIMGKIYRALELGGTFYVVDGFFRSKRVSSVEDRAAAHFSCYFLNSANGEGRVYELSEMVTMARESGFSAVKTRNASRGPMIIVEARKSRDPGLSPDET